MQYLRKNVHLISKQLFNAKDSNCLSNSLKSLLYPVSSCNIHTQNGILAQKYSDDMPFLRHNETIFPPQKSGEPKRPGYVCHGRKRIKYSPQNMWYIACFVRGMSVDEAVKQLSFLCKKGAAIAKEVILEAKQKAVDEHNIEFGSNLWVAESFATKGLTIKGLRRHARQRMGVIHYRYCNYYVRLEEGKPPKHYYWKVPRTGEERLEEWIEKMRKRKIFNSL